MQLAVLAKNWSTIFWKLQWYWSQPCSPPSFSMALTANYIITGIFGLLLTDSFLLCYTASCTIIWLATACCFLESFGIRVNFDKHTSSPVEEIKFLGLNCTRLDMIILMENGLKVNRLINKLIVMNFIFYNPAVINMPSKLWHSFYYLF